MENFVWYSLIVTVVALSVSRTDAVTCYACNSATDEDCKSSPKDSSIGTCNGDSCYKVTGKSGDTSVVIRACYPTGTGTQNGCNTYNVGSVSGTICSCSDNKCNSAISSMVASRSTSFIVGLTLAAVLTASRWL